MRNKLKLLVSAVLLCASVTSANAFNPMPEARPWFNYIAKAKVNTALECEGTWLRRESMMLQIVSCFPQGLPPFKNQYGDNMYLGPLKDFVRNGWSIEHRNVVPKPDGGVYADIFVHLKKVKIMKAYIDSDGSQMGPQ